METISECPICYEVPSKDTIGKTCGVLCSTNGYRLPKKLNYSCKHEICSWCRRKIYDITVYEGEDVGGYEVRIYCPLCREDISYYMHLVYARSSASEREHLRQLKQIYVDEIK